MIHIDDIRPQLKAANSSLNTTLAVATKIQKWLAGLGVPVGEIKFNPRGYGAAQLLIPVAAVEGDVLQAEPFSLQLEINGTHQNVRLIADFVQWFGPVVGFEQVCREAGYVSDTSKADIIAQWGV